MWMFKGGREGTQLRAIGGHMSIKLVSDYIILPSE